MPKTRDMTEVHARLAQFAEWTNTAPPERLLDGEGEDETFSDELLIYCQQTGLSLDWLWRGSAKSYALGEYNRTTRGEAGRADTSETAADKDAAEDIMCAIEKARYRWAALDVIATQVLNIGTVRQFTDARALEGVLSDLEDALEDASRHFNQFCDRKGIQP